MKKTKMISKAMSEIQKEMTSKENVKHVGDNLNNVLYLKHVQN